MKTLTETGHANGLVYLSCPPVPDEAIQALDRLARVAVGNFDESHLIGRFLLSRCDDRQHLLELTDLRVLDAFLFADCIRVLVLIYDPTRQLYEHLPNGKAIWSTIEAKCMARVVSA